MGAGISPAGSPPGPGAAWLFRSSIPTIRDPVRAVERLVREFGDVVSVRMGPIRVVVVGHPDLAREVLEAGGAAFDRGPGTEDARRFLGDGLLVSEGPFHAQQRRRLDPIFAHGAVGGFAGPVVAEAARVRDGWSEGATLDVFDEMRDLLASTMARILDPGASEVDVRRVTGAAATAAASFWRLYLPAVVDRSPTEASRRFRASRAILDRFLDAAVSRARHAEAPSNGLTARILAARDPLTDRAMSPAAARQEALSLLLGARAGVATGLAWAWSLLARHPDAEQRLHAEVDEVLGDRAATIEDIPRLRFTRTVFAESLRLFPPAWLLKRRAMVDQVLGGYAIPAGTTVLVCPYAVHRDARFHREPTRFDPGRFDVDGPARPRYSHFPFGGGAMACIGEHVAWVAGPLVLATIAQRWRLRLATSRVRTSWVITLKPRGGLPMVVESRTRSVVGENRGHPARGPC